MQIGSYIRVIDSITKNELITGKITKATDNPKGYSVDGILFFNPNSKKFKIEELDRKIRNSYNTICTNDKYIYFKDNNIDNTFDYDFFMWNEIEPEVKETCELLNKLTFVETYSSCSGHGKIPAYIDFHVLDYNRFFEFLEFLGKNGIKSYCSKHMELEEDEYKLRFLVGVEGKGTCHLELVDINSNFDKLNKCIRKFHQLYM